MPVEVKKLYNGFASVRDYIIKEAVKERRDLVINYKQKSMRVPLSRLKSKFQLHKKEFKSKYSDKMYTLYEFRFEADTDKKEREEAQPSLL